MHAYLLAFVLMQEATTQQKMPPPCVYNADGSVKFGPCINDAAHSGMRMRKRAAVKLPPPPAPFTAPPMADDSKKAPSPLR